MIFIDHAISSISIRVAIMCISTTFPSDVDFVETLIF